MDFLGRKLFQLREEKNISIEIISKVIGLELDLLKSYENGQTQITIRHLHILADYYGISIDQLLDRTPISVQQNTGKYKNESSHSYKKVKDTLFRK